MEQNNNFYIQYSDTIEIMSDKKWQFAQDIEFTIEYHGEAVESHQINANELATSLLGLSNVLDAANSIIHGSNSKMFVKVRGSFKPGSFDADIVTLLTCSGIQATLNVVSIVGFVKNSIHSLIWLYKETKGEKIASKKAIDNHFSDVTFNNCPNSIVVNNSVLMLYEDNRIRKEFPKIVSPLKDKKMSHITFSCSGTEVERITRNERDYFNFSEIEPIDEKEDTDYFLITQSNFDGKSTGWRLSFGESENDFPVKILDTRFLKDVKNKNVIISNQGTVIHAKYKKITHKLERLSVNWEILEIIDYNSSTSEHVDINRKLDEFEKNF
jgi:hypothetical protein